MKNEGYLADRKTSLRHGSAGLHLFQLCNFLYEALLENASSYILYTE